MYQSWRRHNQFECWTVITSLTKFPEIEEAYAHAAQKGIPIVVAAGKTKGKWDTSQFLTILGLFQLSRAILTEIPISCIKY